MNHPCWICSEPVTADDRAVTVGTTSDYNGQPGFVVLHVECQMLSTVGHAFGVCRCTGWDTRGRDSARVLWSRVNADTAEDDQ